MKNFKFQSDKNLELIIVLSLLTRNKVEIENVKKSSPIINLLNGISALAPNLRFELSKEHLKVIPGPLLGGKKVISIQDISYFIKYIAIIAPFMRENVILDITGITNGINSLDMIKTPLLKIYSLFKLKGLSLSISKRGFAPLGQGKAYASFEIVRRLECICLKDSEPLEKIRGLVVTSRIGSETSTRMINVIKEEMSSLSEVKVYTALSNKNDSGPSPGYECSVYTESANGIFYHTSNNNKSVPEDLAKNCCFELLKNLDGGGLFDKKLHTILFVFMALAHGVSHLRIGDIDEEDKNILDLLERFLNIEYSVRKDGDENIISIIGCDYINTFKPL